MDQKSSFHPNPSKPALALPPGSTDCHCHVFGPVSAFPYAEDRTYTPEGEAPKEKLFAMHDAMGLQRCVIVQAGCHGFDNSVVADAIAARPGRYLGIALAPTDTSLDALRVLNLQGFRGVRFNFMRHLGKGASLADVIAMTDRLAEIGWHLQVHMEKELLAEMVPDLKRSRVPVVIDHMARVNARLGLDQPAFTALRQLLDDEKFWVKVSGSERASRQGPPYSDGVPFARTLVAEHGDRVLWGTDWPHPNLAGPVPDDGQLVDLIGEIAPDAAARQALMVDNPARLYGFE
ncbi:amidohydrolase family protein [Nisaea nitritireducens]|uniref:amidohydrolase family protein n=1 Tax=Nisaea nitritireducens TaxID=568392 RepID=UPI001866954F|nr:amidohydrolase family protein [Nisaea nitritireducens]